MIKNLTIGNDVDLDLAIGAWGKDNLPNIYLEVGYSDKPLQKLFDIPNGESVILLYTKSVMGVTYSDILFYSASDYKRNNDFQTDNKVDFYENRSSEFAKGTVCVPSRTNAGYPKVKYSFKVLYSSCHGSSITWYYDNETFVDKTSYCRQNSVRNSNGDSIDKSSSTTQILTANSDGTVDGFDMLEHNDYIINTEAIGGDETKVLTLTCSDFQHDKIYRITLNNDVYGIELTAGESHELVTGLVPAYTIINVVPVDMTSSELGWQLLISWQETDNSESTYTREETDEIISTLADEEDITYSNKVLKFKDRTSASGMGYVILRKNKTFVEQVTLSNTIYEIRYNFDLGGASITIPENCVLRFEGGKLSNGTLIGDNTQIDAVAYNIFDTDITLTSFTSYTPFAEWFGKDSTAINKTLSTFKKCILQAKTYYCDEFIKVDGAELLGDCYGNSILDLSNCTNSYAVLQTGKKATIKDLKIYTSTLRENQIGLRVYYATEYGCTENVYIQGFTHGVQVNSLWYYSIKNVFCSGKGSTGYGLIIGDTEKVETAHGQEVNGVNFDTININGYGNSLIFANIGCHSCVFNAPTFENCKYTAIVQLENEVRASQGNIEFIGAYFENVFNSRTEQFEDYECVKTITNQLDLQLNFVGGRWANKTPICSFGNKFNLFGDMSTSLSFQQHFDNGEKYSIYHNRYNYPNENGIDLTTIRKRQKLLDYSDSIISAGLSVRLAELYIKDTSILNRFRINASVLLKKTDDPNYAQYWVSSNSYITGVSSWTIELQPIGQIASENKLKLKVATIYEDPFSKVVVLLENKSDYSFNVITLDLNFEYGLSSKAVTISQVFLTSDNDENFDSLSIGKFIPICCESTERPTTMPRLYKGYSIFDTTLNKPIYWNGEEWVDATGTEV